MKIHVRSRGCQVDESVRTYVERRLQFSLGRFAARVLRVTVQVLDVNGPRGGEDKGLRLEVRLRPTGTLFVEDADADLFAAVDRAADRTAQAVSRTLKRSRDIEREREPSPARAAALVRDLD